MALTLYKKKRSFNQTPEPTGGSTTTNELRFVIQKHAASRLHYDFRLEMKGVLKSWAVPKGPSLNPTDKRLAMMVEDHPYDYRNFEGIIPKGNYGAGTVIVWDEGTYTALEVEGSKEAQEKHLLKQLKAGSVKIKMIGKKLKGEFALVRLKGKEENAWLLIKHRDKYADEKDITLKDKSVVSGKTLEKITASSSNVYPKNTKQEKDESPMVKTAGTKKGSPVSTQKKSKAVIVADDMTGAKKAPFPKDIKPMLATLIDKPFEEEGWQYEIKWDGYRAVAYINKGKVSLASRNNKSFEEKFYPVFNELKEWKINAVVDGEMAVLNKEGIAHFGSLQNWRSEADGELVFYVFDLLWLNGYDLMPLSLERRRKILESSLPASDMIRLSENFQTSATEFLATAAQMNMEGIMAKKANSIYTPGLRSREWLKIKAQKRHEVVIGGFTQNEGSVKHFSSLLVGVYQKGKLQYIGKIGTGFSDKLQKEILAKMKPLIAKTSPFTSIPDIDKPSRFRPNPPKAVATWLKPILVCEVSYAEITADGVMRHPSFEGMREDKKASEVTREAAVPVAKLLKEKPVKVARPSTSKKIVKPVSIKERKTLLNPSDETQVRKVSGHELKFSNLSKVYWPKEKYTKRDMLNYYYQVAPYILPYLIDRPQSLNRYPNGITGESFYQKDVTGKVPEWIKLSPYNTGDGIDKNFMVPQDEASILYMANLGAIEMNPWNSTIHNPDNPDWCLIDLDPSEKNTFNQVIETAQVTKKVLDSFGIKGYVKTSGSTGIHIYIPLGAKYSYDECQLFAKLIATQVNEELPAFTSLERMIKNRKGKLYIDYLQNRPKATLAAPYSLRPKPGASVSMPLHWEEVVKGLQIKDFTIKNALKRISEQGDIFKPVLGKGIDLLKLLKKIQA
ncbi:MAG: DNA ligase D [Gloeobacteraceae cyanobacterium ES-bin-316]|nr:DNA ligase D [Ferruginibacter sp.]